MDINKIYELPRGIQLKILNFYYKRQSKELCEDIKSFIPEWHIINVPSFEAIPEIDGTRQSNFSIINFSKNLILISKKYSH